MSTRLEKKIISGHFNVTLFSKKNGFIIYLKKWMTNIDNNCVILGLNDYSTGKIQTI